MASTAESSLWNVYSTLKNRQWVDLTHSYNEQIPHWKGFESAQRKSLYTIEKDGFQVDLYSHVGQWGTHVDPPAHFHNGLRTIDQIPVNEQLLPLVVLDIHGQVEKNADFTISLADVKVWEKRNGLIPAEAFVALRSDWSKRWPDQGKIHNIDAQA